MTEIYDLVEDSFLGQHLHDGAVAISYYKGVTELKPHLCMEK